MQTAPRRHTAVFAAILLALVTGAFAWTARGNSAVRQPARPTAVATIDISLLFEKLQERADQQARLDAGIEQRKTLVEQLVTRGETLRGDIDQLGANNADERREKVRELLEVNAQLEARQRALQEIISIETAQIFKELYTKVQGAVQLVATRDGFDYVVLDTSSAPLPAAEVGSVRMQQAIVSNLLVYANDSTDITERVATLMNNEYRTNP